MHENLKLISFNSINGLALSITFVQVETVLTLLVLTTALIYNLKKISQK